MLLSNNYLNILLSEKYIPSTGYFSFSSNTPHSEQNNYYLKLAGFNFIQIACLIYFNSKLIIYFIILLFLNAVSKNKGVSKLLFYYYLANI